MGFFVLIEYIMQTKEYKYYTKMHCDLTSLECVKLNFISAMFVCVRCSVVKLFKTSRYVYVLLYLFF